MALSESDKNKLKKYGLSGLNKPKRTPDHPTKKAIVAIREKMVALRLFALVTRKWGITIRLKLANLLRLGMEKTLQKARLLLHTGLTKCSGLVKVAQQNPLLNQKHVKGVKRRS